MVAAVTLEVRVSLEVSVERSLELVHQIARREAKEEVTAFWSDARITGLASTTTLLQKVLTDGTHAVHCAAPGPGLEGGAETTRRMTGSHRL